MGKTLGVDRELSALIEEVIAAELLAPKSLEFQVARRVAEQGQASLDPYEKDIWETKLLPILSKPLNEQIAIASILRRGGYVPRKISL